MKRFLLPLLLVWTLIARAQEPLCIVNGTRCADIGSIPPERIERVEQLPADEETCLLYTSDADDDANWV